MKVIKIGRIIGIREGLLKGLKLCLIVRVDKFFMLNGYGYMIFYRCFLVKDDI